MLFRRNIAQRERSFFNTQYDVASERAKMILNSPEDSQNLAHAIREVRHSKSGKFTLTKETSAAIIKESEKIEPVKK